MDILYTKGKFKLKGRSASAELDGTALITRADGSTFEVDAPGEYEAGGVSIIGVPFMDSNIYVTEIEGLRVCVLNDKIQEKLTSEILDALGPIDICISANQDLAKQTDPWVVVTLGAEGLPKYSVTHDKLPADLQVVVLTSK